VVFAGTPDFAVPALRALIDSEHTVQAVYTQPDRPAGRGRKLQASPVKKIACQHGIPVRQPPSLRDPEVQRELAADTFDVMVVVAYGLLLPPAVLEMPRLGCLNIHGSLLPRWRGAAPLQRAILAGDRQTGVTIMLMDEALDTGDMLAQTTVDIQARTTAASLHDVLAEAGGRLLQETMEAWCRGDLVAQAQNHTLANYAGKLDKGEAMIDWHTPATEIDRKIRAFNPWPVAETTLAGERLRLWCSALCATDADSRAAVQSVPGTVLHCDRAGLLVQTGAGVLVILELQLPGKRAMSARDFVNGRDVTGTVLGAAERVVP